MVRKKKEKALTITPYGGCSEFGMNFTGYRFGGTNVLVDCGGLFPDEAKLGVDFIFPNIFQMLKSDGGIDAYLLTHGHEDHIGAIVPMLEVFPAPIYTCAWTAELVRAKLEQNPRIDRKKWPKINVLKPGDRVQVGSLNIEWVQVNHSIPDACALVIRSDAGNVFHTADFKFDDYAIYEKPFSEDCLESFKAEGIDLLLADSTGAMHEGQCPGEASVKPALLKEVRECSGVVVVSTFSSNLWRVLTAIEVAKESGRKLMLAGRGLLKTVEIAVRLGYLPGTPVFATAKEIRGLPRDKVMILATGCQGEYFAALGRFVRGEYRDFKLKEGDKIILSSRVIPGNEKPIFRLMASVQKQGIEILTTHKNPEIHVSGHAQREDLRRLLRALQPRQYVPIHGSHSHLLANKNLAVEVGMLEENVVFVESGSVLKLSNRQVTTSEPVDPEWFFVDSGSAAPLPSTVLNQRLRLGEFGGVFISAVLHRKLAKWVKSPAYNWIGLPGNVEGVNVSNLEQKISKEVLQVVASRRDENPGSQQSEISEWMRLECRKRLQTFFNKKIEVYCQVFLV